MLKRGLDVVVSLVGLALFLPLMLVLALWVMCDSRGPIL